MTTAFNDGQRSAFLISLKAGGVGLNLTSASHSYLGRPLVDQQLRPRRYPACPPYQSGAQCRSLSVITRGTIEEKIQELRESKRNLVSTILDGAKPNQSLWRKFEKFWEFRQNSEK